MKFPTLTYKPITIPQFYPTMVVRYDSLNIPHSLISDQIVNLYHYFAGVIDYLNQIIDIINGKQDVYGSWFASTLQGHSPDYFAWTGHNHDSVYLMKTEPATNSRSLVLMNDEGVVTQQYFPNSFAPADHLYLHKDMYLGITEVARNATYLLRSDDDEYTSPNYIIKDTPKFMSTDFSLQKHTHPELLNESSTAVAAVYLWPSRMSDEGSDMGGNAKNVGAKTRNYMPPPKKRSYGYTASDFAPKGHGHIYDQPINPRNANSSVSSKDVNIKLSDEQKSVFGGNNIPMYLPRYQGTGAPIGDKDRANMYDVAKTSLQLGGLSAYQYALNPHSHPRYLMEEEAYGLYYQRGETVKNTPSVGGMHMGFTSVEIGGPDKDSGPKSASITIPGLVSFACSASLAYAGNGNLAGSIDTWSASGGRFSVTRSGDSLVFTGGLSPIKIHIVYWRNPSNAL